MNQSTLQEKFDAALVPVSVSISKGEFEHALQLLEQFYHENSEDGTSNLWLKNKCTSWRALILERQGKSTDALSEYLSLDFERGSEEYILTKTQIAKLHLKFKEHERALAALNDIMESGIRYVIDQGLPVLVTYADIVRETGLDIAHNYIELLKKIIAQLHIENLYPDASDKNKMIHIISDIQAMHKKSNRNHTMLCMELSSLEGNKEKRTKLEEYIQSESMGYYKNLAKGYLNNLES